MKKPSKKEEKIAKVMREFRAGTLKSSSGRKVTSLAQARAIAMSEAGMKRKEEDKKKRKSYTRKKR
jgi:hypothetical protein